MKKFIVAMTGLAGLMASPAIAAPTISMGSQAASFGNGNVYCGMSSSSSSGSTSTTSGTSGTGVPCSFTDTIVFSTSSAFNLVAGTITTISAGGIGATGDINLTNVTLDGMSFSLAQLFGGMYETGALGIPTPLSFSAGTHTLVIKGTTFGSSAGLDGSYGGNLNFSANTVVQTGVPEPSTWLSMMLGFGALGFAMRRQVKPTRRVNFSMN
jgi:hypothetical protein